MKQPRHKYKMKTCEVCGREYKAFPHKGKNGGVSYTGTCPYCGTYDASRDGRRGHLEVGHTDENGWE